MKLKLFFIFCFLFFSFFYSTYAYVNIDSCQEINSSFSFDASRKVILNTSIITTIASTESCILLNAENMSFSCDGYGNYILGNASGSGIRAIGKNISLSNCLISNFTYNVFSNNILFNFTSSVSTYGKGDGFYGAVSTLGTNASVKNVNVTFSLWDGFFAYNSHYSNFNNIIIHSSFQSGLYISGTQNSIFSNIYSYNNSFLGIRFNLASNNILFNSKSYNNNNSGLHIMWGSNNNQIYNNYIYNNSLYEIEFYEFIAPPINNIFYGNIIGDSTSIYSNNWPNTPNFFNNSNYGNIYLDFNYSSCGISSYVNNSCTYNFCNGANVTINGANNIVDMIPLINMSGITCNLEYPAVTLILSNGSSSGSASSFYPVGGSISLIIGFVILFGFFIFA
ncbi:MAG: right-handed parallel beta-helix repeat-containing protein [Nanoarchaeota archaeon]|nr:right-handed parallel beta-helix repeat-containing protein [Nanoarchaeota archaeon]